MKYSVGEKVIHRRNGVSVIFNIISLNEREYYIVRVLGGDGENIYVPLENEHNVIRPIMNKEEADELLKSLKDMKKEFNPNTKQRRDAYKKRLSSGNVEDVAYLYRQNYLYEVDPSNVKLGPSDIDMLNQASKMLLNELRLTYDVDEDEIKEYVIKKIESL